MTSAARFRHLFEYEQDAHAKVMASLNAAPMIKQSLPEYRRALSMMAHIVVARRIWLFRLGAAKERPTSFFPEVSDLSSLAAEVDAMQKAWAAYLATLDDAAVARVLTYQTSEGDWYRSTVEDILTQLYGHSLYHRGQIAMLLRTLGCQPAETDYIFYSRRQTDAASTS